MLSPKEAKESIEDVFLSILEIHRKGDGSPAPIIELSKKIALVLDSEPHLTGEVLLALLVNLMAIMHLRIGAQTPLTTLVEAIYKAEKANEN